MTTKLVDFTSGLGIIGLGWYILGLIGWFYPFPAVLIVIFTLFPIVNNWQPKISIPKNKILVSILSAQIGLNALGLLVPETSFDAVWYHLPEAKIYADTGRISKIPEQIYSTMPRLGEVLFASGFWFFGPKIIIFTIYLMFLAIVYQLGKIVLTQNQSLVFTIIVNSFSVIAWQSTAGYVDILRSLFELASIYILLARPKFAHAKAGMLIGFALSVKMQSIIGLIASLAFILVKQNKNKFVSCILFLVSMFVVAFPWYYDNYLQSGHPWYPLNDQTLQQNMYDHSSTKNAVTWFYSQITKIPLIPFHLSLRLESQLTPLLLVLFPLLFISKKYLIINHKSLILYTATFMLLWWFLPPPETRYALTGIICLLLLELIALFKTKSPLQTPALLFIAVAVLINFTIRLAVTYRNLPVILGYESHQQFVSKNSNDFNRDKMGKYYSGYWDNYQYHD